MWRIWYLRPAEGAAAWFAKPPVAKKARPEVAFHTHPADSSPEKSKVPSTLESTSLVFQSFESFSNELWSQDRRSQTVVQTSPKSWFPNCCILGSAFHSSSRLSITEGGSLDWLGRHSASGWFMGPGVLNDAVHFCGGALSEATPTASAQDVLKTNM